MQSIKEKPKGAKAQKDKHQKNKGQSVSRAQPAISAKQAAKLLKDKYVQQLDQRQPETGSAETQAIDQVEGAGSWAVDELLTHEWPQSPRQPDQRIKEQPKDMPEAAGPSDTPPTAPEAASSPNHESTASPRQRPGPTPKEKAAQVRGTTPRTAAAPAEPPPPTFAAPAADPPAAAPTTVRPTSHMPANTPARTMRIKERPAIRLKEQTARTAAPSIKEKPSSLSDPSIPSIKSIESIESIESIQSPKGRTGPPAAVQTASPAASHPSAGLRSAPKPDSRAAASAGHTAAPAGRASTRTTATPASPSGAARFKRETQQQVFNKSRRGLSRQPGSTAAPRKAASTANSIRSTGEKPLLRVRSGAKGSTPKIRGAVYRKGSSGPKAARAPIKSAVTRPIRGIRQTAQRRMTQQAVQRAGKAARTSAAVLKKAVIAVTKAASALISALAGIVGGGILLMAMVVIIVIAAIANSPFGLFFAQESNAPDTVSVAQAVGTINMACNSRLELLQAGDYDSITIQGQAPDWPEVLAVFAVKTTGADVDGLDVATLDADRVNKLTAVFWDMTAITVTEETIEHEDSDPDDDTDDSWTEKMLHITITPQTADDMRITYAFTDYQNSTLNELLSDRAALSSLAGNLAITSTNLREVLTALPDDLDAARRDTVQTALQLVGKVNYFWGGKSHVIGWNSRWGTLQKVTAAGSPSTGTYRPFGLDCSGMIDWVLWNCGLHSDGNWYIGTNLTAVSQAEAQPGDFALYPDASHIGIVVGRNEAGKLLVCHCSSGRNNVVVTEFSASGFTAVGRPDIFDP